MITIQLLMMGFPTPPGMTHVGQKNNTSLISPVDIQRLDSIPWHQNLVFGVGMFFWEGIPNFSKNPLQWKKQRNRGPECKSYQKACNGMDRCLNQIRGHQTDELQDLLERKGKSRVGCWVRSFHPRKIIAQAVAIWMSKNFTPISTDLLSWWFQSFLA